MEAEETFAEIARLLNLILAFEGEYEYDVGVETGGVLDFPRYLLGRQNPGDSTTDVVGYIEFNDDGSEYEFHEGAPNGW